MKIFEFGNGGGDLLEPSLRGRSRAFEPVGAARPGVRAVNGKLSPF